MNNPDPLLSKTPETDTLPLIDAPDGWKFISKPFIQMLGVGYFLAALSIMANILVLNGYLSGIPDLVTQSVVMIYGLYVLWLFICAVVAVKTLKMTPCFYTLSFWVRQVSAFAVIAFAYYINGVDTMIVLAPSIVFGIVGMLICLKQHLGALAAISNGEQVYKID